MKRISILFLFIFIISPLIFSFEFTDTYKNAIEKENEALSIYVDFQKAILGHGYLPDVDFEYANKIYKEIILTHPNNPFYYAAYGFTFFYLKDQDSAFYYFNKASLFADVDYAVHFRLFQLYKINRIENALDNELDQFIGIKYKLEAIALPDIAEYLNILAIEEFDNNRIEKAEKYFIFANEFDPYNTEIIMNLLKLSFKKLRFGNMGLIVKMFKTSFNDIFNKFILIYNLMKFLRYFVIILFFILTILFFVKNFDIVFYVIENSLNRFLSPFQKKIGALFIIFIPLILEIHPIIWIFYLSFLNFFFIRRREKFLIGVLLLFIILMPIGFKIENHILGKMNTDDNLSVIVKAMYSPWDISLIKKIDKLAEEQPLNNGLFFARAMLYKKGGYFSKAEEEYHTILQIEKTIPEIYNNLGNIMFFKGFYEKAEEYYNKAISLSPKMPEPYFNLGQVYIRKMQMTEQNKYLEKASSLDYDLINNFMENSVEGYFNTELIDCRIPEKYLWNEFMKRNLLNDTPLIMSVKIEIISIIAFLSMLFSGIWGSYYKHKKRLKRCYTCGKPLFNKLLKDYNDYKLCSKCFNSLDSTVSDTLRARKFESYLRMKNKKIFKKAKIASFIIPGAGKVFQNKLMNGLIILSLAIITVLFFFSDRIFIYRNPHIMYNIGLNKNIPIIIILFIFYLISFAVTKDEK